MLKIANNQDTVSRAKETAAITSVARYLHQLRAITIIRHLIPVIIVSQQHRGASLALLEGDKAYQGKVVEFQNEIEYRLTTLQLLNQELSRPVNDLELEHLRQEWINIRAWSGGKVLENFNLQSHFIEKQMKLVWRAKEKTNYFYIGVSKTNTYRDTNDSEINDGYALLIQFILHETLELIELLAKTRGLSTHAMVIGTCDSDHYSWLEYLLREINIKKERFRNLFQTLQKYMLSDIPCLADLQMQDSRMVQLVQFVEKNILRQSLIKQDSQEIFNMATAIIQSHTELVYQGLDFIQNMMHRQFDGAKFELV